MVCAIWRTAFSVLSVSAAGDQSRRFNEPLENARVNLIDFVYRKQRISTTSRTMPDQCFVSDMSEDFSHEGIERLSTIYRGITIEVPIFRQAL